MKTEWRVEFPQLAIIAGMFTAAALTWPNAPAQMPVHWNVYGQADGYGGKFEALLLEPLITLGLYLAMRVLPRVDPGRKNYELFSTAYDTLRIGVIASNGAFYTIFQLSYHGVTVAMNAVVPIVVGVLFILIGNLLGKVRPNWFVGIRTPWTLSSKTSWNKTHRFGGWAFIVAGLVMMISGFLPPPWNGYGALGIGLGLVIVLFCYSYAVWRTATDKIPPAGTSPA